MFDDTEKENLTEMNEVREKIYGFFAPLSEAFTQGKTVRDETTVLYELIEKLEIEQSENIAGDKYFVCYYNNILSYKSQYNLYARKKILKYKGISPKSLFFLSSFKIIFNF